MNSLTFVCPGCGKATEMVTRQEAGYDCQCGECSNSWRCDDKGVELPGPTGDNSLRLGQKVAVAVLAGMPSRDALNSLVENWGNLKGIDPKLTDFKSSYSHKPATPVGLGRNSPVTEPSPIKTAAEALRQLQAGTVAGAVFSVNGKDIAALWRSPGSEEYRLKVSDNVAFRLAGADNAGLYDGSSLAPGKAYQVVNLLRKFAVTQGAALMGKTVSADASRGNLRKSRLAAKTGHPYFGDPSSRSSSSSNKTFLHPSSDSFKSNARQALRQRLDQFKAKIAPGVDSPEKMVAFIKANGFFDKLRVGEHTYHLQNTQIDIGDIKKASAGTAPRWHESGFTVTYTFDDSGKSGSWYSLAGAARETGKELPPREFKVHFRMNGGTIVPAEVHVPSRTDEPDAIYGDTAPAVESHAVDMVDTVLQKLREKGHRPGCACGFCKNKGSFKKKTDKPASAEPATTDKQ